MSTSESRRSDADGVDIHCRAVAIKPGTIDENTRTVEAVLATESPVVSTDARTGRGVLEVWRMDGYEGSERSPLFDNHQRGTVRNVLGSITEIRVVDGELRGRLQVSEAEPQVWTKVREGHLTDVSGGVQPLEVESVARGTVRMIRGASYAAPKDRDLNVVTKWRLREVSLTPIGADPRAKIRSHSTEKIEMKENVRKYLETIGLRSDATAESAQEFYEALPEATRSLADGFVPAVEKAETKPAETQRSETVDAERLRAEAAATERKRISEIEKAAGDIPKETVRKAIDEGMSVTDAKAMFLDVVRTTRSASVGGNGPAIHNRSLDRDAEIQAIGYGLAIRHLGGDTLYNRNAAFVPDSPGSNSFSVRRFAGDEHKKSMERALDYGDRFRSMSLHDVCREACRLDGIAVSSYDPAETFRSAVSGSSLSAIFTTNVNAMFLTGYMDYSDSTVGWCSEMEVNNFLSNERATMGKFGSLTKAKKGSPADHLDTADWKESYKIARYTGQFALDEQDIINDRFGALESESPKDMGLTAAQIRPNLVYGALLANAALDADSVALFHATHANLGTGGGSALAASSVQAGIVAMAKQRINGRVLNVKPRYLIVPADLRFTAEILLTSAQRIISADSGGTFNPLQRLGMEIVADDRIGAAGCYDPAAETTRTGSATNWFLAARPGEEGAKTIEVGYLRGSGRAPQIRSFVRDKGEWGLGWDVKFDIGVKPLDFRGMYKSAGA